VAAVLVLGWRSRAVVSPGRGASSSPCTSRARWPLPGRRGAVLGWRRRSGQHHPDGPRCGPAALCLGLPCRPTPGGTRGADAGHRPVRPAHPVYAGGPVLADGARSVERTVYGGLEQIKAQLSRLTTALGPQAQQVRGAVRFCHRRRQRRRAGHPLPGDIAALSNAVDTLAAPGDLSPRCATCRCSSRRCARATACGRVHQAADLGVQLLNDNRTSLAEALRELDSAPTRSPTSSRTTGTAERRVDGLGSHLGAGAPAGELENILHNAPRLANFYNIYDPASALTGASPRQLPAPASWCAAAWPRGQQTPSVHRPVQAIWALLNALATNYPPSGEPDRSGRGCPGGTHRRAGSQGRLGALALPGRARCPGRDLLGRSPCRTTCCLLTGER